ncbi:MULTISPECIES: hypothetical protein [unclassified Mesorhizobium]|uniref:hypothetical protein n=1 Tax=unclassified Mesorhizobium TaxID=325217 RepID=UPI0033385926
MTIVLAEATRNCHVEASKNLLILIGSKERLGGISKMGNPMLRSLLVYGESGLAAR